VQLATLGPPQRTAAASQLAEAPAPQEEFSFQDVRSLGEAAPWTTVDFAANPLRAAQLGSQIALLWKRQDRLQMGTVDLTGGFVPLENVEVFQPEPPSGQGEDIRNYVLLGALMLSSMLALALRGRVPLRPIALPPGVAVADLFRRLLAGLIDLVPMSMLAGAFAGVPPMAWQEFVQRAKDQRLPDSMYYAGMGAVCLYAVYCAIMEYRFGWTLGKALMKIRVTDDQGRPASLAQVALRNVLKIIELLFVWPGFPILLLVPLLNRSRLRLGDLIARTVVVSGKPAAGPPGGGANEPPRE
jgi:uncharacterized RDD family membrane protein YckC